MRLQPHLILYVAETVVNDLLRKKLVNVEDRQRVVGMVESIITDELELEDKLNDEVRELLAEHYEAVRTSGAEYNELFKKVKSKLAEDKGIIL